MNSLFWVNLLIGCGMLLSRFKQLPVTFSWRKLAVIFRNCIILCVRMNSSLN